MENIKMPFAGKYPMTQDYGVKVSYMRCGYHTGIDWGIPKGTELVAVCKGKIIKAAKWCLTGYGREVQIEREDGLIIQYAHMNEIFVDVGIEVEEGTIIGKSGNTGFVIAIGSKGTGAHLHFGTMYEKNWFDPKKVLEGYNLGIITDLKIDENAEKKTVSVAKKIEVKNEDYEIYRVQKGDSLYKIAQCFFKNGNRWKELWSYNKDTISDPKKIKIGQVIKIPKQ